MMTIFAAANASSVYSAALMYAFAGLSVLPCKTDKSPALRQWKHLQARPANEMTIALWERTNILASVGIICGEVSNGLIVIDCDGENAVRTFARHFPGLTNTYTVLSGSGNGAHFYLWVEDVPPTTRTVGQPYGNIELRSNGAYVIAPPSCHPSGRKYSVRRNAEIKRVAHLRGLRTWIEDQIRTKHGGVMPPPVNRVYHAAPYARAALNNECQRVSLTTTGRNNALNAAAFRMARFVRSGEISREEVEMMLEHAAAHLTADDGIAATRRTIQSGLDAGLLKYNWSPK